MTFLLLYPKQVTDQGVNVDHTDGGPPLLLDFICECRPNRDHESLHAFKSIIVSAASVFVGQQRLSAAQRIQLYHPVVKVRNEDMAFVGKKCDQRQLGGVLEVPFFREITSRIHDKVGVIFARLEAFVKSNLI